MGKLKVRTKQISLEFMGEEWKDCSLTFRALNWADAQKLQVGNDDTAANVALQELLQDAFVSGTGIGEDGEKVELDKTDLVEFDLEAIAEVTKQLAGAVSPNA